MTKKTICLRCSEHPVQAQADLSPEIRMYLGKTRYKSLCRFCSEALQPLLEQCQGRVMPAVGDPLEEGLHYYTENGYWVFTTYYHLLRGYCCGSGCRHCPYGCPPRDATAPTA